MQKTQTKKLSKGALPHAQAARSAGKPEAFSDSFTTEDACFSVEIKNREIDEGLNGKPLMQAAKNL